MVVYLDHAATTPMLPEARRRVHRSARHRRQSVVDPQPRAERASGCSRRRASSVAASLGCDPIEVVFTSGGTEAVNLAHQGPVLGARFRWSTPPAHPGPARRAPRHDRHGGVARTPRGGRRRVAADRRGRPHPHSMCSPTRSPRTTTSPWSPLLWANNEVGTVQPVAEVAAARGRIRRARPRRCGVRLRTPADRLRAHPGLPRCPSRRTRSADRSASARSRCPARRRWSR